MRTSVWERLYEEGRNHFIWEALSAAPPLLFQDTAVAQELGFPSPYRSLLRPAARSLPAGKGTSDPMGDGWVG